MAAVVALWGTSAIAIKAVSTTGFVTVFYRLWFSIPLLWLAGLSSPAFRRRLDRRWLIGSLAGGALFALHQLLFFNALKETSVANVTIIGALQPVLVLLVAGPMFGENLTRRALLWSGVAVVGTALVVLGSAPAFSTFFGDLLAVLNLFAFTAYFLVSKQVRREVAAWHYVIGMTTVSGMLVLLFALAGRHDLASPSGAEWLVLLFLAVFPGTLGHVLTNWAHAHASAFVISMWLLAVPVVSAASAVIFLGESLDAMQIVGGFVVIVSIAAIVTRTKSETAEELAEGLAGTDAP
jgi:drug/metabolite transporter (DMT)-like permease